MRGVDRSEAMIAAAREADSAITFDLADAAALPYADGSFDLVVAFLSLMDMDDMAGAIRETARVLVPGGRLCLVVVHPINAAGTFEGDSFVIAGSYLASWIYRDAVSRNGLDMTFVGRHVPLETYVEELADAGFVIERLREPAVPEHAVQSRARPALAAHPAVPAYPRSQAVGVRIIAGERRGARLVAPAGRETRPTGDRAREALFAMLGDVAGLRVLDAFAGSGALGLEALSRGAAHATFWETSARGAARRAHNVAALGYDERSTVRRADARAPDGLRGGARGGLRFDPARPAL